MLEESAVWNGGGGGGCAVCDLRQTCLCYVGGSLSSSKKKSRKRRYGFRRRVSSRLSKGSLDKVDMPGLHAFANPTFQAGTIEEAWFDSVAAFDPDCDDDYQSVPDEVASLNGIEGNRGLSIDQVQKPGELSAAYSAHIYEAVRSSDAQFFGVEVMDKHDGSVNEVKEPVFLDEFSSVDASSNKDDEFLDNCGILPNNCLPCLASTVPSIEKRSSSPTNARKKAPMKLSFKWREGHGNSTLFSSKTLLQRPIAGSQVPFCPIEKEMLDCWSHIDPSTFKVRGVNYFKDKKKDLSPREVDHIARFVELPLISSSRKLPPILVVNVQIPLYPAHFSKVKLMEKNELCIVL